MAPSKARSNATAKASPFSNRIGIVTARELIGSSEWYRSLWERRDRIAGKPALVLWGMKDPAFGPDFLRRWKETLTNARVVELAGSGHFVPEEEPERVASEAKDFLAQL